VVSFSYAIAAWKQPEHRNKQAASFNVDLLSVERVQRCVSHGKVVVPDLWGTWCKACSVALPLLKPLAAGVDSQNVVIISIGEDDAKEQWEQFVESNRMNWSQVYDDDRSMRRCLCGR